MCGTQYNKAVKKINVIQKTNLKKMCLLDFAWWRFSLNVGSETET